VIFASAHPAGDRYLYPVRVKTSEKDRPPPQGRESYDLCFHSSGRASAQYKDGYGPFFDDDDLCGMNTDGFEEYLHTADIKIRVPSPLEALFSETFNALMQIIYGTDRRECS